MSAPVNSRLYTGRIWHSRRLPRAHAFDYQNSPTRDERFPDPYNMGVHAEEFLHDECFADESTQSGKTQTCEEQPDGQAAVETDSRSRY